MQEKEEKKWLKIVKIVANALFYVLICILLIFSISNLTREDTSDVAAIFGRGYCTVLTDSMVGDKEDSFTPNDLILVKKVTEKNREKRFSDLEIGSIITFKQASGSTYILNTHRIVDIDYNADGTIYSFVTQGDNVKPEEVYDPENPSFEKAEKVLSDDVRGIYTGKIKGLGKAMKYLQTSNGFMLCVVLPMALIFIVMALILILNVINISKAKSAEQHAKEMEELKEKQAAMLEEEKARIRAELLAEQEAAAKPEASVEQSEEQVEKEENKEE